VKLRALLDDIESLAVGAWILGTGGGGNPYLPLLNMRLLYRQGIACSCGRRDLADDDWSAPLPHGRAAGRSGEIDRQPDACARRELMERHIGKRFTH
jgi:hypothetical protein